MRDHAAPAWHVEIDGEERSGDGSIRFRLGVDPADVERVHAWLERRPHVAEAAIDWTRSGPPWDPFPRWDPHGEEDE